MKCKHTTWMVSLQSLCLACGSDPKNGTERKLGAYIMKTCFQTTTISSAMFITAMAANPLAVSWRHPCMSVVMFCFMPTHCTGAVLMPCMLRWVADPVHCKDEPAFSCMGASVPCTLTRRSAWRGTRWGPPSAGGSGRWRGWCRGSSACSPRPPSCTSCTRRR